MVPAARPAPESAEPLAGLPRATPATIVRIDWAGLRGNEARRMRELGFDEGVGVEKLHTAPFGQDPIAIRVGRMTIAIRRAQAAAVWVARDAADPLAIAAE